MNRLDEYLKNAGIPTTITLNRMLTNGPHTKRDNEIYKLFIAEILPMQDKLKLHEWNQLVKSVAKLHRNKSVAVSDFVATLRDSSSKDEETQTEPAEEETEAFSPRHGSDTQRQGLPLDTEDVDIEEIERVLGHVIQLVRAQKK